MAPARMDLRNQELVEAHLHSEWLAKTGLNLGRQMLDILDLDQYPAPSGYRFIVRGIPRGQMVGGISLIWGIPVKTVLYDGPSATLVGLTWVVVKVLGDKSRAS